ncbi:hypothetical protein H2202_011171 [Exophiala xenobiotica]|nr:hypothetical protein H2202_011171 [Exophiala xenobiotica]KAK5284615.1 hypothetical protein LTR14_011623 [Exophiala xenobiotica]KAK5312548.1 hypothetical protein LTR93_011284 [Exophiala xenobiotica]
MKGNSKRLRSGTALDRSCKKGKIDTPNEGKQSCLSDLPSGVATASGTQVGPDLLGRITERLECLSLRETCDYNEDSELEVELATGLLRIVTETPHGKPLALSLPTGLSNRVCMIGLDPRPWALESVRIQPSIHVEYMRFNRRAECDIMWSELPTYDLIILLDAELWQGQPSEFITRACRRLNPGGVMEIYGLGTACFKISSRMEVKVKATAASGSKSDLPGKPRTWEKALNASISENTVTQVEITLKHGNVFPGTKSWQDQENLQWFVRYVEASKGSLSEQELRMLQDDTVTGAIMHFVIRGKTKFPEPVNTATSSASSLVGTWSLLSYTACHTANSADVVYPMGKACTGQLVYTQDNFMSVMIQSEEVPPYEGLWLAGTTREHATAASSTLSYSGTYEFGSEQGNYGTVLHHIRESIPPNWRNTTQKRLRKFSLEDGRVILTLGPEGVVEIDGKPRILRLRWERVGQK